MLHILTEYLFCYYVGAKWKDYGGVGMRRCPGISVLMGIYDRSEDISVLRRSVESILHQTFSDFEFLICDDGSSKQVQAYLDGVVKKDSRVRLIRSEGAFLLPVKLNRCLEKAHGKYIARMDGDDFSHPDRFQKQMNYLSGYSQISFVGCNVNLIQNGKAVGKRCFPEYPKVRDFYVTQPYIHPTLIFRRKVLEAVNGYSEDKSVILCEDYDLLLRLYAKGFYGANLQEALFDYTIPATVKGNRKMYHRWNEVVTRYRRFGELDLLPSALPYVVKPLAVEILPEKILKRLKGEG